MPAALPAKKTAAIPKKCNIGRLKKRIIWAFARKCDSMSTFIVLRRLCAEGGGGDNAVDLTRFHAALGANPQILKG